ncbi:toxin-antitoxin system YwqK family antitoxin [Tenacibaculum sp. UWU-22]|uniref:toxin-antitoxin system YwqK family antitoxin n=1 Tax=Tenacibaculum sp. UWU-22 TaxID=3234187 RepID=UPI0034DB248E
MKTSTLLLVLLVGFLSSSLTAQKTIWFDANWETTTKEKAHYYRPVPEKKDNKYWVVDYYLDGTKQMEGYSSANSPEEDHLEGLVLYYYPSGKISHKIYYKDGAADGKREEYYESGELKEVGNYENGKRSGIWKTYYKNGKIQVKGKYEQGEKVGIWKSYYKNE